MLTDRKIGFFLAAAILAGGIVFCSCGYTMRPGVIHGIARINIGRFENETYEHGLELEIADAIAREFIADGNLRISDARQADAVMTGSILEYIVEPYTYGASEADVEQYRLVIRAEVVLTAVPEDKKLWRQERIEGEAAYFVEGPMAQTEHEAAREALRDLSRRVVERTVMPW